MTDRPPNPLHPTHHGCNIDINVLLRGLLHELRNPLSSILTASSLVQDCAQGNGEVSEETQMLLGVIDKESRRLNTILTEFANYIKLPEPHPSSFDVVQSVQHLIAQNRRNETLQPSVAIEEHLPASCFVFADETQVRMALQHLLSNAAEAMPQTGMLQITLETTNDSARICLHDSGEGFNRESHERAFQPFYSTKPYSVGLGLSSARAILEAAGGRIWIDSEPSTPASDETNAVASPRRTGSICFELPLADSASTEQTSPSDKVTG